MQKAARCLRPSGRPSMLAPMLGRPRQIESETALYEAAIKILMRRAHSVMEMKKALLRRCGDDKLIRNVVDRLKREGLIDDARYANQFARQRAQSRKQGKFRIARELRARGVQDNHIEAALEASALETDEAAMVRQRIERKLKLVRGAIDEKKIAALYRSLLRAGFPSDVIRKQLELVTKEEVGEIEPDEEE